MKDTNQTLSHLSKILTQVLNVPIISGLLLVYLYFRMPVDTPNRWSGFVWAMIFISLIPFLSVLFFIPGKTTDRQAILHRQRTASFVLMAVSYPIGWLVLHQMDAPKILEAMAAIYSLVTLGLIIFNLFLRYKASGHAAGIAGPVAAMIFLFGLWSMPLLALLPLVSWVRVRAKGHTFGQTVVGSLISFVTTIVVLTIFGFTPFQAVLF